MLQRILKWNRGIRPVLWCLVLLGVLACIVLGMERRSAETSANQVEIVLDYHDLQEIAGGKSDPDAFVRTQFSRMKEAGISTLSVNENSLEELEINRRVRLFTAKEAAMLDPSSVSPMGNETYVLFAGERERQAEEPLIRETFAKLGTDVEPWGYGNLQGLKIHMPLEDAKIKPLPPDPLTFQELQEAGFRIIVRLSDRRDPFDAREIEKILRQLQGYGVKTILFDGEVVTGFSSHEEEDSLYAVAELLKKHGMSVAFIELQKKGQKGFQTIAAAADYRVVRLHSLTENETSEDPQTIADRLVLAVKDRNIRLLFLNAKASKDPDKGIIADTLDNLYDSLEGPQGAVERIRRTGYELGQAQPFTPAVSDYGPVLKGIASVGAVAFISLALAEFVPAGLAAFFILGLMASAGLYILSSTLLVQALALGVGVFAPVCAVAFVTRSARRKWGEEAPMLKKGGWALGMFFWASLVSLAGAVFIVGLLSHMSFLLGLNQFRGVSVLHLAPIGLSALYLFFFSEGLSLREMADKAMRFFRSPVSVFWFAFMLLFGAAIAYYLTRTGNEGQVSEIERTFRAILENTLGVRPRTKELLAHPLWILGAYLAWKHRNAVYMFVLGVIGQLSMVNTFSHLHTPLDISALRAGYGMLFGALIGTGLIVLWEGLQRSWNRWMQPSKGS